MLHTRAFFTRDRTHGQSSIPLSRPPLVCSESRTIFLIQNQYLDYSTLFPICQFSFATIFTIFS